ncbi:helix-turn-helix domain-containing protein [Pengzhenrongella sp.]|jgi:DNA-binding MarR family transcriptional regulator|uniref:helix-turn-helix domain-containing protein n=1 Tax=Pengzhenrongella sp. TaxID=2888820 RepID=UPI002F94BE1C
MTADDDALVRALVDLAEVVDGMNAAVRQRAEKRRDQTLIPVVEVRVLRDVLRHPDSSVGAIAASTGLPASDVAAAAGSLGRRGLLAREATGTTAQTSRFRATPSAVDLRDTAREVSAQTLRYALAGISSANVAELEAAARGLGALGAALGWQDIHDSYRDG